MSSSSRLASLVCFLKSRIRFKAGRPGLRLQNTVGSGDSCFQLWRESEVTDCLHNSVQGDLKGRCELRDRVMRRSPVIYPNMKQRKHLLIQSPFQPRDLLWSWHLFRCSGAVAQVIWVQISGLFVISPSAFWLNCLKILKIAWNMKRRWINWFWQISN